MSDAHRSPDPAEDEQPQVPHRVIGTPPPAQQHSLLGGPALAGGAGGPGMPRPGVPGGSAGDSGRRELPGNPDNMARAKTAERIVAALFVLSMLASIGFIAAYVGIEVRSVDGALRSNLFLGMSMSIAFLAVAVGAVIWVRHIMPTVELTEERHPLRSSDEHRAAFKETFAEGAEASQFVKRPLLRRTLIAATVPLAVAPIVLLRDLGPLPGTTLRHTVWRKGMRLLAYGSNRPLTPAEFSSPGGMITVVPDGYQDNQDALAAATAIIIKFRPGEIVFGKPMAARTGSIPPTGFVVPNWTVDNIVCYSKICTHVGCPAALYEQTTHHILCPCHQSTFDATRGAEVIFGPAPRPLPQLPITTDAQGYLIAQSDFTEPVGPSFWERG
jgi:ubiquinol-cytochrome c reductase iron-sulfur subunit